MKILQIFTIILSFSISTHVYATEIIEELNVDDSPSTNSSPQENTAQVNKYFHKKIIAETFEEELAEDFELLGHTITPGTKKTLRWSSLQSPLGYPIELPVIIINGTEPGPVLSLTAAIHGDELNGIEMIRQVIHEIDPTQLKGVIIGIPIVNLEGFWRKERYIGDRRDLNRYFPGSPEGSYPARVAHTIFTNVIQHCDIVVDLHTGSFFRENLPQLRVDLKMEQVADLAGGFGAVTALQSVAPSGSLRGAATAIGIPAIVMEIGGPLSLEIDKVSVGVKSLRSFLLSVGMISKITLWPNPQPIFYGSEWLRADAGGILLNKVNLGDSITKGSVLAEINNPITNETHNVISTIDGTILGRAQNQFVSPGFALFHVGHKKSIQEIEQEIVKETQQAVVNDK